MRKFSHAQYPEERKFVEELFTAIAARFNGAVKRVVDGTATGFEFSDQRRIYLRYDGQKHRVDVSCGWPQTKLVGTRHGGPTFTPRDVLAYKEEPPVLSITVDADKSAEKIAADIERRLMPGYNAIFERCLAAIASHEKYVSDCNTLAQDIALRFGVANRAQYGDRDAAQKRFVDLPGELSGSVETSDDTASFTIRSLPSDKALKLATFLATL